MNKPDDIVMLERCAKGDRQAFEALVARYQKPVYNAAYRMLHSQADAQDVTQTVFLKVFERVDQFDARHRFFSWVYRITLNESINWLKKANRLETIDDNVADESGSPEKQAGNQQLGERMQEVLMTISADYRQVIILKHVLGCSYREMSEILDVPEKTVKSRLYSARQIVKNILDEQGLG